MDRRDQRTLLSHASVMRALSVRRLNESNLKIFLKFFILKHYCKDDFLQAKKFSGLCPLTDIDTNNDTDTIANVLNETELKCSHFHIIIN